MHHSITHPCHQLLHLLALARVGYGVKTACPSAPLSKRPTGHISVKLGVGLPTTLMLNQMLGAASRACA